MCLYSSIGLVFCCFGLLGTLELNLKFCTFIFHKLSRQSPPLSVVNGEWMTSSTVTKSPKSESETRKRESGVLLPTFKTSRDNDDFKNNSGSSRFCPPLLLRRPQVPPYWGQTTSSIRPPCLDVFLSKGTSSPRVWKMMSNDVVVDFQGTGLVGLLDGSHLGLEDDERKLKEQNRTGKTVWNLPLICVKFHSKDVSPPLKVNTWQYWRHNISPHSAKGRVCESTDKNLAQQTWKIARIFAASARFSNCAHTRPLW